MIAVRLLCVVPTQNAETSYCWATVSLSTQKDSALWNYVVSYFWRLVTTDEYCHIREFLLDTAYRLNEISTTFRKIHLFLLSENTGFYLTPLKIFFSTKISLLSSAQAKLNLLRHWMFEYVGVGANKELMFCYVSCLVHVLFILEMNIFTPRH